MSESHFDILKSVVAGVPWTEESAQATGANTLRGARTKVLAGASFWEDDEWEGLDNQFQSLVEELGNEWGPPFFLGNGADSEYEIFHDGADDCADLVAIWKRPNCFAFVTLAGGDNTRSRAIFCGERSEAELHETSD
jgi:hypothetical protein